MKIYGYSLNCGEICNVYNVYNVYNGEWKKGLKNGIGWYRFENRVKIKANYEKDIIIKILEKYELRKLFNYFKE
jgi:hypothetical protein